MDKFNFMNIRLLSFTFFTIALAVRIIAQPSFITDSLDKYMDREMQRWNVPGMAVAVIKDGKVVVMKGYGIKDAFAKDSQDNRVNEYTLFQIASNSKAFTGTSIAILDYQKRLSLEDKVTKWMPDFKLYSPEATNLATIRDMLSHRIGFKTFQSDFLNWGCKLSRKELITNMRNVKPEHDFRTTYGYCNAGFLTAGEIIPLVTDTSWDDYLKHHFFVPLKMDRTSTTWNSFTSDKNACKPHTVFEGKYVALKPTNIDNFGPAASINSCINDLAHWLQMQLDSGRYEGKNVVPFQALAETRKSNMIVRDFNGPGSNFQTYGLGWFMYDFQGHRVIRHDGGADGFVTTTCFVPSKNLGIVVLSNTDANSLYAALRNQILDAYFEQEYSNVSLKYYNATKPGVEQEEKEIRELREAAAKKPKSKYDLKDYTGTFTNEVYGQINIVMENNLPVIQFTNHTGLTGKLEPLGGNDFLCTYSIPTYGVKKLSFIEKGTKIAGITVKVNDFIDYLEYTFTKP